jgi:hypothetical protein
VNSIWLGVRRGDVGEASARAAVAHLEAGVDEGNLGIVDAALAREVGLRCLAP